MESPADGAAMPGVSPSDPSAARAVPRQPELLPGGHFVPGLGTGGPPVHPVGCLLVHRRGVCVGASCGRHRGHPRGRVRVPSLGQRPRRVRVCLGATVRVLGQGISRRTKRRSRRRDSMIQNDTQTYSVRPTEDACRSRVTRGDPIRAVLLLLRLRHSLDFPARYGTTRRLRFRLGRTAPARFEELPDIAAQVVPRGLVRRFQRERHVISRVQKQRCYG